MCTSICAIASATMMIAVHCGAAAPVITIQKGMAVRTTDSRKPIR